MEFLHEEFKALKMNFFRKDSYIEDGIKILATGMTGPIGLWAIRYLYWYLEGKIDEFEINILTRAPERAKNIFKDLPKLKFINQDIQSLELEPEYDFIIHGAAPSAGETYNGMTGVEKFYSIFRGMEKILSISSPSKVRKIIFLSSGAVYGPSSQIITEKNNSAASPLLEVTGLAQGKRAAEYLLSSHCALNHIPFTILRCFSFSGYGMPLNLHYALGNFVGDALKSKNIVIKGSGEETRSFMHLGDFAAIMLHAFFAKLTKNMFNVGGDKPYSLIDVAELVREVINPSLDIIIENKPSRIGNAEISRYICDPSPILNEVGIHPTSLEKSVKTMLI